MIDDDGGFPISSRCFCFLFRGFLVCGSHRLGFAIEVEMKRISSSDPTWRSGHVDLLEHSNLEETRTPLLARSDMQGNLLARKRRGVELMAHGRGWSSLPRTRPLPNPILPTCAALSSQMVFFMNCLSRKDIFE